MDNYGQIAKFLHWSIAFGIISLLVLGFIMINVTSRSTSLRLIELHKSIGLTLLALMTIRLVWRLINPTPRYPTQLSSWQKKLASYSHYIFYLIIFGIILVGWIMSGFGGHVTHLWGILNVTLPLPLNSQLERTGETIHLMLAYFFEGGQSLQS